MEVQWLEAWPPQLGNRWRKGLEDVPPLLGNGEIYIFTIITNTTHPI
jgi:hypothetical protein